MIGTAQWTPLGGLSERQWNDLAGDRFYSSGAWLRYCARMRPGSSGAIVVPGADAPAAAVPVTNVVGTVAPQYRWRELLERAGLPAIAPHGLLLGALQGYQTHFLVRPGGDVVPAVGALVERARGLPAGRAGEETARVAMYLRTADALAARDAGTHATPVLLDADAWLEVPPAGWEAWLQRHSYKRRVAIKRERRRFEEAGHRVVHAPLAEHYQKLGALARVAQAKYGAAQHASFYVGLMRAQVAEMGDAARVALCVSVDGDVVGFCIYYHWGGTVFLRWAGFDYDRCGAAASYFNVVYYTHIMDAPTTGVRLLHAGRGSLEAKVLRGARLTPLWLLDVGDVGPMTRAEAAVREHNRARLRRLLADPRTAPGIVDADEWKVFG